MALVTTIAGVDRSAYVTEMSIDRTVNGIGVASLTLEDPTGAYLPSEWDTITIVDGSTDVFAGYIVIRDATFILDFTGLHVEIDCVDNHAYLDRTLRNGIEAAGQDIGDHVTALVTDNLATYGFTVAAGQVAGPTIATPVTNAWATPRAYLNYLSLLSGYLFDASFGKALEMFAVGSRTGPATLSAANGNIIQASWSSEIIDYVNAVWISHGGSQVLAVTDSFVGDGVTRSWVMRYYAAGPGPGSILVNSVTQTCGVYGVDTTMEWTFDVATRTLYQKNTFPVLTGSDDIEITFNAQFPNDRYIEDSAEIALRDLTLVHIESPEIVDVDEAEAAATAYIRVRTGTAPKQLKIRTRVPGFDPGDIATVDLTSLGLSSASYFVQSVSAEYLNTGGWWYELDLVSGSELPESWQAWWVRTANGGSGAGSGSSSGSAATSITTTISGKRPYYLGGSYSVGVTAATAQPAPSSVEVQLTADDFPTGVTVRGQVKTKNGATTVTPVLQYDSTGSGGWTTVQSGSAVSATSWTRFSFAATLPAGTFYYRLALLGSNGSNDIFGIGYLEG